MRPQIFFTALLLTTTLASAQEPAAAWKHESEAAVVTTSGNTETQSYSAKQKTSYTFDSNILALSGSFLQTRTSGTETAKNWDASLRYERTLTADWSLFAQVGAEAAPYSGITQRDNADLGGKYYFIKKPKNEFFAELGARVSRTLTADGTTSTGAFKLGETKNETMARAYVEYTQPITETVDGKLWVEYLPNFTNPDGYRLNFEPSLYVAMNNMFSLKLAYLSKTDNAFVDPKKKTDTISTVSLVAKF